MRKERAGEIRRVNKRRGAEGRRDIPFTIRLAFVWKSLATSFTSPASASVTFLSVSECTFPSALVTTCGNEAHCKSVLTAGWGSGCVLFLTNIGSWIPHFLHSSI